MRRHQTHHQFGCRTDPNCRVPDRSPPRYLGRDPLSSSRRMHQRRMAAQVYGFVQLARLGSPHWLGNCRTFLPRKQIRIYYLPVQLQLPLGSICIFVSYETPQFVTATHISRPNNTSSQTLLSSSPAAPQASVPIFPSSRPSDDRIPSNSARSTPQQKRNSTPEFPARWNTIEVDGALFNNLNALDFHDSFFQRSTDDSVSLPQSPQRRTSDDSSKSFTMQTASSKQSLLGTASFNITDLSEDGNDADDRVENFAG